MTPPPVYTVGHSTRTIEEFFELLTAYDVDCLVDVRAFPASRKYPQFNKAQLKKSLKLAGRKYVHLAELGGRRGRSNVPEHVNAFWRNQSFHHYADYALTSEFAGGISTLVDLCRNQVCALMCAEAVWWRCHRRIVTDYLLHHQFQVCHILSLRQAQPASMTPAAEAVGKNELVYPDAQSSSA